MGNVVNTAPEIQVSNEDPGSSIGGQTIIHRGFLFEKFQQMDGVIVN